MPIEIRELVIKAAVQSGKNSDNNSNQESGANEQLEQAVQLSIEQLAASIKNEKER